MTDTAPPPDPVDDAAPDPVDDPAPDPVDDPAPDPVDDAAPDRVEQRADEVAPEPPDQTPPSGLHGAMAVIEVAEGQLGDVEAALERLESGQYRVCEICGTPLDSVLLATAPTLRRCLVHAG